jgi:Ion transport protein
LKAIALNYIMSPTFWIDVLSTFPTLFSYYSVPELYYIKIVRLYFIQRTKKIIKTQIQSLETCQCMIISKQTISKIQEFASICLVVFVMMHSVSCMWLLIGEKYDDSWIRHPLYGLNKGFGTIELEDGSMIADWQTKYITSFYWSVTTLATVGYGDVKGFTWQEYCFTMFVEFIGIAFFSFVMGSINNNFLTDSSSKEYVAAKIEQVDIWLVKLDNSRTSKSLPKILYEKIKVYIRESLHYDHKKLVYGFDFLYQLKPKLRKELIHELFR